MKKIILLLIVLLVLGAAAYLYLRYSRGIDLAGIQTPFSPPKKDIVEFLPQGAVLDYPLKIPRGFVVGVFADLKSDLPRVLAFDPRGVLVTSITKRGRVVAMPDKNNDGRVDEVVTIVSGLDRPHGIAFSGSKIYIAETDKVVRYSYDPEAFSTTFPETLFTLPGGANHFTRTIKIIDGKLYTSVGSSCDTCIERDVHRAAMLVSDLDGSNLRIFASGLRNTVFFAGDSDGVIWGNDMGRDFLGDNLPPDELNVISDGKDYGWPYCYGDNIRDSKFKSGERADICSETQGAEYDYPAHVAPLGITFIDSPLFSASDQGNILTALHGSWNSSVPVGYKVVKLNKFAGGISGISDFLTGWLQGGEVLGRPVDLIFDEQGRLFISDDKAGLVYIISR